MVPESKAALSLRGWIDMTCGREGLVKKSIKYFEEAMSLQRYILHTLVLSYTHTFILSFLHITFSSPSAPKPLDALLGKCRYYYQRHNFSHALEQANLAVASYPKFLPALVEKMRVLLALQDWDQAVETAQRLVE